MKYHAKLPKDNDNVSNEHPLREFFILLLGACCALLLVYWLLGKSVDLVVDHLPDRTQRLIHQQATTYVENNFTTTTQNDDFEQAASLFKQLQQCAGLDYPVTLHWQEQAQANAFALPGGHIVLLSGLMDQLESENGLAFVLAHELAHFQNRDHLRAMGRGVVMASFGALIGLDNAKVIDFLSPIGQFEGAQYSQQRESQADEVALSIVNCHYQHVGGVTEFFHAMAKEGEQANVGFAGYLSSHPQSQVRINKLEQLINTHHYRVGSTTSL